LANSYGTILYLDNKDIS